MIKSLSVFLKDKDCQQVFFAVSASKVLKSKKNSIHA
jgi:hypothetical protein